MLVRSDLNNTSLTEVLGEILIQDIFKKSQADAISLAKKVNSESIALKAKPPRSLKRKKVMIKKVEVRVMKKCIFCEKV
jgi:hypothetical protein